MNAVKTEKTMQGSMEKVAGQLRRYDAAKRICDVTLALLALAVMWPLMLAVAAAVWLERPKASPIFTQTRVGLEGRQFTIYKFRTMEPDAEENLNRLLPYNEMNGPTFKIRNDPRITKLGRFLRRWSIDELPQLWNVLKGEMSIVGPRPPLPREAAQYDAYTRQRLTVLPGLTCYWQIQPDRNSLPFSAWLELDLRYIHRRSILTDWKIIFATFAAVLKGDGQ